MAGLVPAIYALPRGLKNVDARDKPGHDGVATPDPPAIAIVRRGLMCDGR